MAACVLSSCSTTLHRGSSGEGDGFRIYQKSRRGFVETMMENNSIPVIRSTLPNARVYWDLYEAKQDGKKYTIGLTITVKADQWMRIRTFNGLLEGVDRVRDENMFYAFYSFDGGSQYTMFSIIQPRYVSRGISGGKKTETVYDWYNPAGMKEQLRLLLKMNSITLKLVGDRGTVICHFTPENLKRINAFYESYILR